MFETTRLSLILIALVSTAAYSCGYALSVHVNGPSHVNSPESSPICPSIIRVPDPSMKCEYWSKCKDSAIQHVNMYICIDSKGNAYEWFDTGYQTDSIHDAVAYCK